MQKKQERTLASEHRQNFTMSAKERRVANIDARDISVSCYLTKKKQWMRKKQRQKDTREKQKRSLLED
jgi:hypothetical protein